MPMMWGIFSLFSSSGAISIIASTMKKISTGLVTRAVAGVMALVWVYGLVLLFCCVGERGIVAGLSGGEGYDVVHVVGGQLRQGEDYASGGAGERHFFAAGKCGG